MTQPDRDRRLADDIKSVQDLAQQSSILDCEVLGEPAHRLLLTYRGKGWVPDGARGGDPRVGERHEVELLIPSAYPKQAPEIRFQTALFHPAVSLSGATTTAAIGLDWHEQLGLEILCERIWDVIRAVPAPVSDPQNGTAQAWFTQRPATEPIDRRPLKDRGERKAENIVSYRLRGSAGSNIASPVGSLSTESLAAASRSSGPPSESLTAPPVVDPTHPSRPVIPVPSHGIQWTGTRERASSSTETEEGITFVEDARVREQVKDDRSLNKDASIVFLDRNTNRFD